MKRSAIVLTVVSIFCVTLLAQSDVVYPQPTNLITLPTAGMLPRGAYGIETRIFRDGGLMAGISVGISNRFMFGISYGGSRIIGNKKVILNEQPGVEAKYRFIEETQKFPAILIGFNSQGFGTYQDTLHRYETKARGFYAVASKNFRFLGNLGLHAGLNYNPIEDSDGDSNPTFFFGLDKDLNREISLLMEYDAALNDDKTEKVGFGVGKGYLNAGIRWALVQNFHVELDFNNILLNRKEIDYFSRELKINFIEFF